MTDITERQKEILAFIKKFTEDNSAPPTIREIMVGFDIGSPNGAMCHIRALEKKGYITRKRTGKGGSQSRGIRLTNPPKPLHEELREHLESLVYDVSLEHKTCAWLSFVKAKQLLEKLKS